MNVHLHISYPCPNTKGMHSERAWIIPSSIREKCITLLGGDPHNPQSIPIRKGYVSQSEATVPLSDVILSLGRNFIEIPSQKTIDYTTVFLSGYEFLFEEIDGAWMISSLLDILCEGYTHEKIHAQNGIIYSIGEMRKIDSRRSDGGPRYLLKYNSKHKKWNDIYRFLIFQEDPETTRKECHASDEIGSIVF